MSQRIPGSASSGVSRNPVQCDPFFGKWIRTAGNDALYSGWLEAAGFSAKRRPVRADRKELLTFDFDEVIADSEAPENTVLAETITGLGGKIILEDALDRCMRRR
jgi:hypothetical protein